MFHGFSTFHTYFGLQTTRFQTHRNKSLRIRFKLWGGDSQSSQQDAAWCSFRTQTFWGVSEECASALEISEVRDIRIFTQLWATCSCQMIANSQALGEEPGMDIYGIYGIYGRYCTCTHFFWLSARAWLSRFLNWAQLSKKRRAHTVRRTLTATYWLQLTVFESQSKHWICLLETVIEGSLEVKLPTIWTDEKQRWKGSERRVRLEERRVEEKESEERRCRCAKR